MITCVSNLMFDSNNLEYFFIISDDHRSKHPK